MTTTSTKDIEDDPPKPEPIRIFVNPRFYQLAGAAFLVGTAIGLARGSRLAGLRFRAENAHRPPTTMRGWYFYQKTKNYKMILGGLHEAGKHGSKLGLTVIGWVGAEEALRKFGWDDVSELGAGLFTAGTFSAVYRLPWKATGRIISLGLMVGGTMRGLRWVQGQLRARQAVEVELGGEETQEEG